MMNYNTIATLTLKPGVTVRQNFNYISTTWTFGVMLKTVCHVMNHLPDNTRSQCLTAI